LAHVTPRLSGLDDMARGLQINRIMITGTSAMRIRYKQTECTCVVCGIPFIAFSTRAKTCTEVCRKRLSRQRQRQAAHSAGLALAVAPAAAALTRFHVAAVRSAQAVTHRPAPLSPIAQFLRLAAPG
jgi:predicted nucleic acid-binding Zn ribbon protein